MRTIFLTLPVADPTATAAFFTRLGFRLDTEYSDELATCMVLDRNIYVVFVAREHVPGGSGTGSTGEDDRQPVRGPVTCLTTSSRAEVDQVLVRAAAGGGRVLRAAGQRGQAYGGSFTDPDGHAWELMFIQPDLPT